MSSTNQTTVATATFARVQEAYDLERMAATRIIFVGTGGAAAFIEDLARAGIGEHVLIDPDIVTEANLATQQTYRHDIGRQKIVCLAERIQDIHPQAVVSTYPVLLDDLDDTQFSNIINAPLKNGQPPSVVLLCGLTDNFYAQARVNRIALHFGIPSLCAQVYYEGRGAEVTFTFPGVTPACHRCILSSRYNAFLKQGYQNKVTSDGTPIFATTRLNAIKGFVTLALLHHGTSHKRWGDMLLRIGKRNLLQIRMDPDLSTILNLTTFEKVFSEADKSSILFDETIWRAQDQEGVDTGYLPCPDCDGTGDLRNAIGTFEDTREMRIVKGIE
ncbi:MAG TPA: ThiF family adenylyltransferase [Ktedonobacteraceae bacterium]|nr:ThiF family adenylyltransferase [Ktedonobacteraceae bacterium]